MLSRRILVLALISWLAILPAASVRADETDDQFAVAAGHYDRQQWNMAVEEFQEFLKKHPDDRRASQCDFFLGEALLQLGKVDDACGHFLAYVEREPDGKYAKAALFRSGETSFLAGNHTAAKRELEAFRAKHPDDRLNMYVVPYLGDIALSNRDLALAVVYFRDALARFPNGRMQDDCRFGLGRALEQQNQVKEAEALYQAVASKAGSALADAAQFHLGALQYSQGRYDQALDSFSAFDGRLVASSWQPNARLGRGLTLLKLGRPTEAIKQFDGVLTISPLSDELKQQAMVGRVQAALQMGWSQFKEGKLTEAAATFDALLGKSPPDAVAAEAAWMRGQILERLGRKEPALAMYDVVIDKYPASKQHVDALLAAARLREKLKQSSRAASLYQRLAKEHPQFPKLDAVLYEWAWALQGLGKPDEATTVFERLHREWPQSRFGADAACRLAQRAFDAKDYVRAAKVLDEVLAARTDSKVREYAMFLRGQIAAAKSDWPLVREAFETFAKEFPDSRRRLMAEYWVAEAYYHQGDYAAADARFERLAAQVQQNREPWMGMVPLRCAQIMAQQNRWSDAFAMAAKIAADFPNFEQQYEVDYLLGRCLANSADFEGARHAYNQVIRSTAGAKTETAAMAQWMIGETYFHQKNYRAALREYSRLEILYAYPTWQAGALLQAGKCCELLSEPKEAGEFYRRIVKSYGKTSFAEQAAERLKRLETAAPAK